jgi:hypothetical protein
VSASRAHPPPTAAGPAPWAAPSRGFRQRAHPGHNALRREQGLHEGLTQHAASPVVRPFAARPPGEYDPDDPGEHLDHRGRRDTAPRRRPRPETKSRAARARGPSLLEALASLLTPPPEATPPAPTRAPARPTPSTAGHAQPVAASTRRPPGPRSPGDTGARRAPPQQRTRAVLACGHAVILGGAPESWYGVAAPCPICRCDLNVVSTKPASGTGPARKQ